MTRNTKIVKKIAALFLVLLLSINSFAAVVSDNDGSAFITKAEFDSLKNNFQTQLDQYNTSIDSKIDAAIASYLAGITTEVTSTFSPFVEVAGDSPQIIGREYDYGNVTQRFFNEISAVASIYGAAGGAIQVFNPMTIGGDELKTTWGFWVQPLSNLKSYGRGYEFDENGNVTSIYENDNIVINMTFTDAVDPYSVGIDFGSWFGWVPFNNSDPKLNGKINTQYIDYINAGNHRLYRRATADSDEHTQNYQTVLNNYDTYLFSHNDSGGWFTRNTDAGRWTNLTNSIYFIHKQEKRETDISVYNAVDAKIYAYQKDTKYLESFADIVDDDSLSDMQRRWQLFTYQGNDNATLTAYVTGKVAHETYNDMNPHRAIYTIGKFKIANVTDVDDYKPLYKAGSANHNQWNNLYQFQNGYMKYTYNDKTYSPKFYGGVPLFTPDKDLSKVTFKIKAEKSDSLTTKIRLWFKEYEFPNDYVILTNTSWNETNPQSGEVYKNELVTATSNENTTNSESFIDISVNTEITITLKDLKKGVPYFMKFAEYDSSGNMVGEGGKIVYLSEFQKTMSS